MLGIRVTWDRSQQLIVLDQEKYLKRTLKKFGKYTPLAPDIILSRTQAPTTDKEKQYMANKLYQEVIG